MKIPAIGDLLNSATEANSLRLQDILGGGSFGDVFQATELSTGKLFAVKFPRASSLGNEREIVAFRNEVLAAGNIDHPNVVKIFHVELDHPTLPPYILMEFVEGGTLKSHLNKLKSNGDLLDPVILKGWTLNLVRGISCINEKMLHRDLKPDNILVSGDSLKIGDFGLSKIVDALTRTNTFKGGQHILYMAPEGWRSETNKIQLDMYSLGIVLFEMATLGYPYDLPSVIDHRNLIPYQEMHFYQRPKQISDFRSDLPVLFNQIVMKLLEKRPEDRFEDWIEVEKYLGEAWSVHQGIDEQNLIIEDILSKVEIKYIELASRKEEQARLKQKQKERERLDYFQWEGLIEELDKVVEKFNERSVLGKIRKIEGSDRLIYLVPPEENPIVLSTFDVRPEVTLNGKGWIISLAVAVHIEKIGGKLGTGFNYLLCRQDETDIYGKWIVCKVAEISAPKSRHEPFGFSSNKQLQEELKISIEASHIYQVELSENIQDEFLRLINQAVG